MSGPSSPGPVTEHAPGAARPARMPLLLGGAARVVVGTLGGGVAGYLAFGFLVLRFSHPASQCVLVGALASAIWAAVRLERHAPAVWLVVVFASLHTGANLGRGAAGALAVAAWSVAIGLGLYLVGLVYDRLARAGLVFGKFLVIGPLVGGLYAAATPLASLAAASTGSGVASLWRNTWLGIVLGDGAAFGVEAVELWLARWERSRARP